MAMVKDAKKAKGICDNVFTELSGMQKKIMALRDDVTRTYGIENDLIGMFERHLHELADQIEWKLQILSHACSYDWKGSSADEYTENVVSVGPAEKPAGPDFSGGYLGG